MGDQAIEILSVRVCLEQAVGRPGPEWRLLLSFHAPGEAMEDCSRSESGRPGLGGDPTVSGFGIVVCSDVEEVVRLIQGVQGGRAAVEMLEEKKPPT